MDQKTSEDADPGNLTDTWGIDVPPAAGSFVDEGAVRHESGWQLKVLLVRLHVLERAARRHWRKGIRAREYEAEEVRDGLGW